MFAVLSKNCFFSRKIYENSKKILSLFFIHFLQPMNQNPEQKVRDDIDKRLKQCGWEVQDMKNIDLQNSFGVAVREYKTDAGFIDYLLFANREPVGIIEAKRTDSGHELSTVEEQSAKYYTSKLKHLGKVPLYFSYESTGEKIRFTHLKDKAYRSREVFAFHRPETLWAWAKENNTLRNRLQDLPALPTEKLRDCQIEAIENLENSFKEAKPKALIQMATGSGKTFTAITFIYRLLKFAEAKRVLFLVDTKNLGEQAEQEFRAYTPNDDNRKFIDLYNVQRLSSSYIAPDCQVYISTIQRLYSILQNKEMDEKLEEQNPNETYWAKKEPLPVGYNPKLIPEFFDFVVIDECHRSIYNLWQQVLDYFDAFQIGLTATPDSRTFGYFNQNVVSHYDYEKAVTDGVLVPYEVFLIETEITKNGAIIKAEELIEKREKLSFKKRWEQLDEDLAYSRQSLDRDVVNPSQIRSIIRTFRENLPKLFPNRYDQNGNYEVPKTLIFAKTDQHAEDIVHIVREEFGEGNEFCKKITYQADNPKSVLQNFRNEYNPRIAVTVDMIATGTDVKPLEILLFMRDVKSRNYFEQMKGRGTRTIDLDSLRKVSTTAKYTKTHFTIVDAIGITKSLKTDSRALERKPKIALKDLLQAVAVGVQDEDTFLSLANRLIKLDKQMTAQQREEGKEQNKGKTLLQMANDLVEAHNPDQIEQVAAAENLSLEDAKAKLCQKAQAHFNGKTNEWIETIRRKNEQIIDSLNLDEVLFAGWDKENAEQAQAIWNDFEAWCRENKDTLMALQIFYEQPYRRRELTLRMVKEVLAKLKEQKPTFAPIHVFEAFQVLETQKSKSPKNELVALVSLIRRVCQIDEHLSNFEEVANRNFQTWVFGKQAGNLKYTAEQMEWLRLIKEHITTSFRIEKDDLEFSPFDKLGGMGKMYHLFNGFEILEELNESLVA